MARPKAFDEDTALDAAAELFWSQGYDGTSMADLETAMEMGRQSIYNAFGDKRALFLKALERYTKWNRQRLAESLLAPEAGLHAIRVYFDSMVDFATVEGPRRGCLVANSILEIGASDEGIAHSCAANQNLMLRGFENALKNAARTGELPASLDVSATARLLLSQTYGMSVLSKAGMSTEDLAGSVHELLARIG